MLLRTSDSIAFARKADPSSPNKPESLVFDLPGIGHFAKTTIVPSSDIMVLEIYYCSLVTRTLNFGFCVLCFVFCVLCFCFCTVVSVCLSVLVLYVFYVCSVNEYVYCKVFYAKRRNEIDIF